MNLIEVINSNLEHFATYCDNTSHFLMAMISKNISDGNKLWEGPTDWWNYRKTIREYNQDDFNINWNSNDCLGYIE